ncbi:MAG: PIN domain-containing protein [Alphaproteobacteria bacterium]|nr:PIN domain-containing protein [Alphaproteobacteria bacterium]
MYLADTNVLSAAAPGRQERSAALVAWMDSHSDSLFLSAVTVAEICDGIAKMRRTGSAARAASLEDWLDLMLHLYAERVLPFDIAAARVAGELTDRARAAGRLPGFADIAIAATAASRSLVVLTRNLRHFGPLEIPAHDPFDSLPPPHGAR